MLLVLITFTLIAIGIAAFIAGSVMISKYAFRVSSGTGVGVLLFPPYTFWFAFFKLEQEGKEIPIATWLFGIVSTILLLFVFWQPVNLVFDKGFTEAAASYSGVGETATEEYGAQDQPAPKEEPKTEEAPAEEPAPAETTASADAGTNADAAANNGTTPNAGSTAPAAAEGAGAQ